MVLDLILFTLLLADVGHCDSTFVFADGNTEFSKKTDAEQDDQTFVLVRECYMKHAEKRNNSRTYPFGSFSYVNLEPIIKLFSVIDDIDLNNIIVMSECVKEMKSDHVGER